MDEEKLYPLYVGVDLSGRLGFSDKINEPSDLVVLAIISKERQELIDAKEELEKHFPSKKGEDLAENDCDRKQIYEILKKFKFYYSIFFYDRTDCPKILAQYGRFKSYETTDTSPKIKYKSHIKQISMPLWHKIVSFEEWTPPAEWNILICGDCREGNAAAQIKDEIENRLKGKGKYRVDVAGCREKDPEVYIADILAYPIRYEIRKKLEGTSISPQFGDYFSNSTMEISFAADEDVKNNTIVINSKAEYLPKNIVDFIGKANKEYLDEQENIGCSEGVIANLSGASVSYSHKK